MISVDGAVEWLLVLMGPVFVLALPFAVRAYWRNSYNEREIIAFIGNFIYSKAEFQRGHARTAVPFMLLFGVPFFLFWFLFALFDDEFWNREIWGGNIAGFATLVMFGFVLTSAILYWSIMLYNRPKWLVPPDLRDELGILKERRSKRSRVDRGGAKG